MSSEKKITIYPSITTTNGWRKQLEEVKTLKLNEICLFPTNINFIERLKLNSELERSSVKHIPFVHIRHDFKAEELDYYSERFGTKVFNIHSQENSQFPLENDLSKYREQIFVETTICGLSETEIENYAGICLDTTHVENQRLNKTELYKNFNSMLNKGRIGVAHISAVRNGEKRQNPRSEIADHDFHFFNDLSEFDYVKRYGKYLPEIVALELENSIKDQLRVKEYLKNNIL